MLPTFYSTAKNAEHRKGPPSYLCDSLLFLGALRGIASQYKAALGNKGLYIYEVALIVFAHLIKKTYGFI